MHYIISFAYIYTYINFHFYNFLSINFNNIFFKLFDLDINILKMSSSNTQETAKQTSSQMQNNQKKAGKQLKTI